MTMVSLRRIHLQMDMNISVASLFAVYDLEGWCFSFDTKACHRQTIEHKSTVLLGVSLDVVVVLVVVIGMCLYSCKSGYAVPHSLLRNACFQWCRAETS